MIYRRVLVRRQKIEPKRCGKGRAILAIAYTCHQAHRESIPIFYANNIFDFLSWHSLASFSKLPLSSRKLISKVHVHRVSKWLPRLLHKTGVRTLRLAIEGPTMNRDVEEWYLIRLMGRIMLRSETLEQVFIDPARYRVKRKVRSSRAKQLERYLNEQLRKRRYRNQQDGGLLKGWLKLWNVL